MHVHFQARKICIRGLVQGVGFRPYVFRLAEQFDLKGWVENSNEGVRIHAEGAPEKLKLFITELEEQAPDASHIQSLSTEICKVIGLTDFKIRESRNHSDQITRVSPDISVCEDCLEDMRKQPHRIQYPFINCTHCGPRFTIIRSLPYDRQHTTMDDFKMCGTCGVEYLDVRDRRFHAQPIACNECGPVYTLHTPKGDIKEFKMILEQVGRLLKKEDGILALKGIGGYYLVCDAGSNKALKRLRKAKNRDNKPFAVMVKDLETAESFAEISPDEAELLSSWRKPIVLLKDKGSLPKEINPGISTLGLMFPHMPIHYNLFESLEIPALVMTSGNISDEPIVIRNEEALAELGRISDAVLSYNREIHNRADDSVVMVANHQPRMLRRSKGYVPEPLDLPFPAEGILGAGAELSHCFAMGKGKEVLLSQHIGDLKDPRTFSFFEESVTRYRKLFKMKTDCVACDLHPDYLSVRYAMNSNLPLVRVQHHHAHIAAAMAEFNLDEPVIGVCWDGTGLGSDGNIWGGEFMFASYHSFERYAHFKYVPMPGGDKAAREPRRMGISYLYQALGENFLQVDIPFIKRIKSKPETAYLIRAIRQEINSPLSSSAGRLFDAVAAILNICDENSFHAEAPMRLESILDENIRGEYDIETSRPLDFSEVIRQILRDLLEGLQAPEISAKFHNTLVSIIYEVVNEMKREYGISKVVLTGGVFQNKYLLEQTERRLQDKFEVFSPKKVPVNDAGIALGQVAIAAKQRQNQFNNKLKNHVFEYTGKSFIH